MTVVLHHRVKGTRSYNLTHDDFCREIGECQCRDVQQRVLRGGGLATTIKRAPEPLTLRAGERRLVERAVLACPEVKAALDAKRITVIEE